MKFAQELRRDEQPELLELYKKLKKSLKIFEGPADAGSTVEPDHMPSSDSDEDDSEVPAARGEAEPLADAQQAQQAQQEGGEQVQQGGGAAPGAEPAQQAPEAQRAVLTAEQEARFTHLVEQCVQQLNDDYLSREEMLVIQADLAQSAAYFAGSREELTAAYSGLVNLHGELVLLCHWSMTAYTGIVKILKKHYKRTGQRVQSALLANLLSQPFCSLEEVRGMVRQAESQMSSLAARLGLASQHSPPTAGAAAAAAVRDPRAAQPPAALGSLLASGSPDVGESAGAAQHAQQAEPAERAQRAVEVDVVAASGAARPRPVLKRDRSKQYSEPNKRHEAVQDGEEEEAAGQLQPASSGSSMQVSQGAAAKPGRGDQPEDSASSGGAVTGGSPGAAAQRSSIMQRTRAALQLWKALRANASTPSTVIHPHAAGQVQQ